MAICKGFSSLCKYALAAATVFLVLLSMEFGQPVEASGGCDQNSILGALRPCMGLNAIPQRGSACCNAINYVQYSVQPAQGCICGLAKMPSAASEGLNPEKIACAIKNCIGNSAVPSCLYH